MEILLMISAVLFSLLGVKNSSFYSQISVTLKLRQILLIMSILFISGCNAGSQTVNR